MLEPNTNTDTSIQTYDTAGFYTLANYERTYTFLVNITERVHTNPAYSTTFMLEVLNEPEPNHPDLVSTYYPQAYSRIRAVESDLKVAQSSALTLQFMDDTWGAGDPRANLPRRATNLAFDNHRYLAYSSTNPTKNDYLKTSCSDAFPSTTNNKPLIIGEWSLAIKQDNQWSDEFSPLKQENHAWYQQWWAAQVQAYEKEQGWVFWTWKTELVDDWRWSYQGAVEAGIIPKEFSKVNDMAKC